MDPPVEPLRQFGHRHLQLRQKRECTEIENAVNRVQSQCIKVVLLEPVKSVLTEKTPYLIAAWSVEVNGLSPRRAITTREVWTISTKIIPLRSQMVVDNI